MRDFFINAFELLISVFVVLLILGVLAAAIAVGTGMGAQFGLPADPLMAVGILIGGGLYIVLIAGMMYLGLGIYQNTKKTAEALSNR